MIGQNQTVQGGSKPRTGRCQGMLWERGCDEVDDDDGDENNNRDADHGDDDDNNDGRDGDRDEVSSQWSVKVPKLQGSSRPVTRCQL